MTNAAWPVTADPVTPGVPIQVVNRAETGRSVETVGLTGRGLLRPLRRDRKQDFANGTGAELIASHIGQVLGTICHSQNTGGEVPWRTEFGSLLHLLRLNNMSPALAEKARAYTAHALRRWVPRVRVTQVKVTQVEAEGKMLIRVGWQLLAEGTEKVVVSGLETEIAVG